MHTAMTTESLLLAKVVVSVLAVVLLTVVAEYGSTRLAGLLSGYPLGTAIALFFIGVEHGAQFAADSARYSLPGFAVSLLLVWVYYRMCLATQRLQPWLPAAVSLLAFALAGWWLTDLDIGLLAGVGISGVAIALCLYGFLGISNVSLPEHVALKVPVLLLRGLFAAAIVIAVTGVADIIGEAWAGVLSAFPITLFPFLLLMHISHGRAAAFTIIRNYPFGLVSLVLYVLCVNLAYPVLGVVAGTVLGYAVATAYLLAYLWLSNHHKVQTETD